MTSYAAVVLAGGAARRMGGAPKPSLPVGGAALLTRVLDAVTGAAPRIVVGPLELVPLLPSGVSLTREHPPGSGPVAALAAGLALLPPEPELVAVLAGDLPFLRPATVDQLAEAAAAPDVDGAILVDDSGAPQWLCGVWRTDALVAAMPADVIDVGMRRVLAGLRRAEVHAGESGPPDWFDCDTEDDLRQAEEWTDAE